MQKLNQLRVSAGRFSTRIWKERRWVIGLVGTLVLISLIVPVYAVLSTRGEIYTATAVPKRPVAIVFGAGIYQDGTPTPFLISRLLVGINLYRSGKVRVLLMSGDNSTSYYDEPVAMKQYAISHGVPAKAIVLDYAGYDTYDTCYRAKHIFGVTSAILVSHAYHLPRALMTCNAVGIPSDGVAADRPGTSFSKMYLVREFLSLNKAGVQVLLHAKPQVLGPKVDSVANVKENKE